METKINEKTNEELVEITGRCTVGTPSGLLTQEAQAELTRRLMISMDKLESSSSKYSEKIVWLTVSLGVLAIIQIILLVR